MKIQSTRWQKFGHDRTYLSDEEGNRLGWINNETGELVVESPEHRELLEERIRTDLAKNSDAVQVPSSDWADLALNVPGQNVRERATETLEEMKERSKFWTGVARVMDLKTDERAWRKGAEGEESVGTKLNRLTKEDWFVLHSVPIGHKDSDIDHLLIGHGGVYTINTKNHPGKKIRVTPKSIRVDGYAVPYLPKSRAEAERVRTILNRELDWAVPVGPVLVILTGTIVPSVEVKKQPEDVMVLDRNNIPRVFQRAPKRLSPEQVSQVYEIARRSTTWI